MWGVAAGLFNMKILGVISLVLMVTATLWLTGTFSRLSASSATFTDTLADFASIGTSANFPPIRAAVDVTPATMVLDGDREPVRASIQIAALDVNDINSVTLCRDGVGCTSSISGTVVGNVFVAEFNQTIVNSFLGSQTDVIVFTVSGTAAGRSFEGGDTMEVIAPTP